MSVQNDAAAETPVSLLAQLRQTVSNTAADDLALLARMHEWCELLVKTWQAPGAGNEPLAERAAQLVTLLEKLILGEAENAAAELTNLANQLSDLEKLAALGNALVEDLPPTPKPRDWERKTESPPETDTPEPKMEPPQSAYVSKPLFLNESELDFVRGFLQESAEHIEAIEAALLEVERAPADLSKINDLFRPFHTIKGAAGFLNLTDVNSLTHEAETLLDQARKGQRQITPGVIDLVFDVVDLLKAQMSGLAGFLNSPTSGPVPQPPIAEIIKKLRAVVTHQIDPQARALTQPSAEKIGEVLIEQAAVPAPVVDFALQVQEADGQRKTGQILVDMGVTNTRQVAQAIRAQTQAGPATAGQPISGLAEQSVRIDTTKLDALVDMVGELVIAQTLVTGSPLVAGDPRLTKDVGQVAKILRNLQEVTLAMRMIPIGPTFQKMARLVRDVSRKAGKQVELILSGEDTELDKNVIQQIGDPLVHMVRNAIDHGVELPEARRAAGKPETGRLHLSACHQGGNIIIEISDDGKGLDANYLVAKAIEKGLVRPGAELTEQEAFALIFAPGFSTAEKVTDISGRGVGMDVVKRNLEKLRGKVEILSEKGRGSTFRIRLPLTLAIIDGMVVRVASQRFIIPTIALRQALRPKPEQIKTVQHRGEMIQLRGELISLIQLGELFGLSGRVDPCEAMIVIANTDDTPVGLIVDELIGQQQVVIKSLGARFERLQGIAGAAILGDGRVGLILETTGLNSLRTQGGADRN